MTNINDAILEPGRDPIAWAKAEAAAMARHARALAESHGAAADKGIAVCIKRAAALEALVALAERGR
jgi:hypothetical protein